MPPEEPDQFDNELRQYFDQGNFERTATRFLERYGSEILAFLTNRMRSETSSAEVFSQFAEDFWKGLPQFSWRSSLRAWAYALARNAAYHHDQKSPRHLHQTFSDDGSFGVEVARLRTQTQAYLQSEVKNRMRELRERLSEEDQTLLILRVDRKLSWKELAVALSPTTGVSEPELARLATNLRQRFAKLKERLRSMAVQEGLLPEQS